MAASNRNLTNKGLSRLGGGGYSFIRLFGNKKSEGRHSRASMAAPQHHPGEEAQPHFILLLHHSEHMAAILKSGPWSQYGC